MNIGPAIKNNLERNLIYWLLIALASVLYVPVILHWYDGWLNKSIGIEHEYFSHGMIGLPYAAYVIWQNRRKWSLLPDRAHPLGAFLLGLGAIFYLSGVALWVNISFPLVLIGSLMWLKGLEGLKLQAFPMLLVVLATPNPIPYLITPYTLPLQVFIAGVAGFILQHAGLNVVVDGIYISVQGRLVEVAPYCAGLKMLFTAFYVTLMLLHWTGAIGDFKKTRFMLFASIVISIVANIIRNALLAWFHGTGQERNFVLLHDGWGGDLYSVFMLLTIVFLFKFIEGRDKLSKPEGQLGDE